MEAEKTERRSPDPCGIGSATDSGAVHRAQLASIDDGSVWIMTVPPGGWIVTTLSRTATLSY